MKHDTRFPLPLLLLSLAGGACDATGPDDDPAEAVDDGESVAQGVASAAAPRDAPNIKIDWSVPKRTFRNGEAGGSCPDTTMQPTSQYINRTSWPVLLDGCATTSPRTPIARWSWQVTLPGGNVQTLPGNECLARWNAPAVGDYQVQLTVTTQDGPSMTGSRTVTVRDLLIVSMGDSIASGEGNPDDRGTFTHWNDTVCHRAWNSGHAQAALMMEDADPHTSVTFVSTACSGAGIDVGLLQRYTGMEGNWRTPLPPQVDQVAGLLAAGPGPARRIDALLMTIGANDAGFADRVLECGIPLNKCFVEDATSVVLGIPSANQIAAVLATLPQKYADLHRGLQTKLGLAYAPERTYLTTYPEAGRGAQGQPCDIKFVGAAGPATGHIEADEADWLSVVFIQPLKNVVTRSASMNRWNLVADVTEDFRAHGYCAPTNQRWIHTWEESFYFQGNKDGVLHPNEQGHGVYRDRILQQVGNLIPRIQVVARQPDEVDLQLCVARPRLPLGPITKS
jgi:hypothetical protein